MCVVDHHGGVAMGYERIGPVQGYRPWRELAALADQAGLRVRTRKPEHSHTSVVISTVSGELLHTAKGPKEAVAFLKGYIHGAHIRSHSGR